jgi:aspartate-semialdehyde dehydrogenase
MQASYNIAVVGATGVVGTTLLSILAERGFPIKKLFLLASHRSAGESIKFKGDSYTINDITDFDFTQSDIAFFCTGNDISAEYAPKAVAAGNIVLDKSSHFR